MPTLDAIWSHHPASSRLERQTRMHLIIVVSVAFIKCAIDKGKAGIERSAVKLLA